MCVFEGCQIFTAEQGFVNTCRVKLTRRDPGAVHPAAQRRKVCNALQYQQEQFVNAAQEHQRVAYEQVEVAAAFATNRTAAQMTTRFRDIENNVEANFRHQKRGLLSENTSESAQALEAQRHSQVQEATAEMMRRNTHNLEVVSQ